MRGCEKRILYLFKQVLCTKNVHDNQIWLRKKSSYFHQISTEPLAYKTIGRMVKESVEKYSSREAVVDCQQNVRLTFEEVDKRAENIALGLVELGFKPGDRIGIWGPNSVEWHISSLAIAKAGLVIVDINPAYQSNELLYCIKSVELKCIIMNETFKTQNYLNILKEAVNDLKFNGPMASVHSKSVPYFKNVIIITEKETDGSFRLKDLETTFSNKKHMSQLEENLEKVQADDGSLIQFTSGTTGSPKAALLSHFNVVNNGYLAAKRQQLFDKNNKICIQVPFFHIYGHVIGVLGSFNSGSTLVVPSPSFNPTASIEAIRKERCTAVYGTPTMFVDLLATASHLDPKEREDTFSSLEYTMSGGASISADLMKTMKQIFGLQRSMQVYGMTETSPVTFLHPCDNDICDNTTQTVGKVLEHTEVKVVDTNNKMVPFGTQGELLIRGYCNMLKYWGNEEKTKEIMGADNWLRTGDQFVLSEDGYGQVVGRIKDLIIRGGENIYPKEIEDFLITNDSILEAYVYGVKDERMGEEIGTSIRLKDNCNISADDVRQFCKGKIAHFKIPRYIEFVEEFPKTSSGKIRKFILKENMDKKLSTS